MTTTIRHIIIASIFMLVFCQGILLAQSPLKFPITVTTTSGSKAILWFGYHPNATYCFDDNVKLGFAPCDTVMELGLPPTPPAGVFDARFTSSRNDPGFVCLDQGVTTNIHAFPTTPITFRDTFKVSVQPGPSPDTITLSWPSTFNQYFSIDTLRYTDPELGPRFINGLTQNSLTLPAGVKVVFLYVQGISGTQTAPVPPVLQTPATGSTSQPTTLALSWASAANALLYHVQVASDSLFPPSSIVFEDTVSTLRDTAKGLPGGIKLFWRVRSLGQYVSGCFPSTSFMFITTISSPPVLSAPENGELNLPVSPRLKVRQAPGAISYQFTVSKNSGFTQIVKDTTLADTSVVVGPLENCTQYYWKAKFSTAYATSPFSSGISFWVVDVLPVEPTLANPSDGSVQTGDRPTFSWTSTDACTRKYRFELSYDSLFGTKLDSSIVTQTSYQVQPLEGQETYYWRVAALNGLNQPSAYTAYRTFTTATFQPTPPQLLEPANNTLWPVDSATFAWRKPRNKATSYTLTYDTVPNFSHPVTLSGLTDTSVMVYGLRYCTRYFWKVTATNANPNPGNSTVFNFDVRRNIPDAPILLRPAIGDSGISADTLLRWNGNACTQKFLLQVSLSDDFSTLLVNDSLTGFTASIGMDNAYTIYYWRVQGINELGGGAFATGYFRTAKKTTPKAPNLSSPNQGTLGVLRNPTLCWDSSKSADSYRLQVAVDSSFSTLVFNDSTLKTLCKQVGPLLYSKTYYWRVNAKNDVGTSVYSSVRWFKTLFPPDTTKLIYPDNNATGVSVSPQLQWSIPDRADAYQLQVARDAGFNVIIYNDSSLKNQSWQLYNLSSRTTYFWRVRSHNEAGNGAWSETFNFKTTIVGVSNWTLPITIGESGFGQDSIYFGIHPNASYGIDPPIGEFELAPPMVGQFDARFIDIPSRPGLLGEGLRVNVLPFDTYAQVDTFRFSFQLGTGVYPVHISWNPEFVRGICDSMVMLDLFGGLGLRERMDLVSSASVTNISTKSLLIIVYGAYPVPTDVQPEKELPQGFSLLQNYPNPFNPETRIEFSNEKESMVFIGVYDVLGREVTRLINSEMNAGFHSVVWNGQNQQGNTVPSGIYYLRMIATEINSDASPFVTSRKMLFMK